jgi:Holliday junction resolvasome RuvABC endonuclease subunit
VSDLVVNLTGLDHVRGGSILDDPAKGNIPIPDPSLLTTEQLRRELSGLREVIETRLAGMDQATALQSSALKTLIDSGIEARSHFISDMDRQMSAQREYLLGEIQRVIAVSDERFVAVDTRFTERDTRAAETAAQSRISLDAALAAAKEAVSEQNKANTLAIGKSELATQKQIDSMNVQMATITKSLEDKIADIKGRIDRGEGSTLGMIDAKTEKRADTGQVLAVIGSLVGGVILVIGIITLILRLTGK